MTPILRTLEDERVAKQLALASHIIQPKVFTSPGSLLIKGVTKDFTSRETFIIINEINFDVWEISITINNDNKATMGRAMLDIHLEPSQVVLLATVMIDQILSGYGERVVVYNEQPDHSY